MWIFDVIWLPYVGQKLGNTRRRALDTESRSDAVILRPDWELRYGFRSCCVCPINPAWPQKSWRRCTCPLWHVPFIYNHGFGITCLEHGHVRKREMYHSSGPLSGPTLRLPG